MIDSHCHLDFACFDEDRAEVSKRCLAKNIHTILIPGTQAKNWEKQISICKENPQFLFSLGLHPYFLNEFQAEHLDLLTELLDKHCSEVVAVGEIGLCYSI